MTSYDYIENIEDEDLKVQAQDLLEDVMTDKNGLFPKWCGCKCRKKKYKKPQKSRIYMIMLLFILLIQFFAILFYIFPMIRGTHYLD